jgi:hypothetical protein
MVACPDTIERIGNITRELATSFDRGRRRTSWRRRVCCDRGTEVFVVAERRAAASGSDRLRVTISRFGRGAGLSRP